MAWFKLGDIAQQLGVSVLLLVAIFIWSSVWKALALWKAGRKNSVPWFVVLFLVNTVGILEILYIYVFSEMKQKPRQRARRRKRRR